MRQIVMLKKGAPEVLQIREAATPEPGAGQVRISVKASGVNFGDALIRMGLLPGIPKPPLVPGFEVAGTVDKLGSGVSGLAQGARVAAWIPLGAYSESVVAPAQAVMPLPDSLSFEEGAAIPVVYLSAWIMLMRLGNLQPGERVLVQSAAGGVGLAALDICKWRGAEMIGVASAAKHARLRQLGCAHCIDSAAPDLDREVRRIAGDRGVDIVLDSAGGRALKQAYDLLAPLGRVFTYGVSAMVSGRKLNPIQAIKVLLASPRFSPFKLTSENRGVIGFWLLQLKPEAVRPSFEEVMRHVASGEFRPTVDRSFRFAEAASAHEYLQSRRSFGKLVLVP